MANWLSLLLRRYREVDCRALSVSDARRCAGGPVMGAASGSSPGRPETRTGSARHGWLAPVPPFAILRSATQIQERRLCQSKMNLQEPQPMVSLSARSLLPVVNGFVFRLTLTQPSFWNMGHR
jgi:hypothetical protein